MSASSSISLVAICAACILLLAIVGFGFTSLSVQIDSACSSLILTQEIVNRLRHEGPLGDDKDDIDVNEPAIERMLLRNADRMYKVR